MQFKDLNLTFSEEDEIITFNNEKIKVYKSIASNSVNDLLMLTLQKSLEDNGSYVNPFKADLYFHLHLVYCYTDLVFDIDDRLDEMGTYDKLVQSGLLDLILHSMDKDTYDTLYSMFNELIDNYQNYANNVAAMVKSFINDLPKNAEEVASILKEFNPEDFKQVMNFAEAAGYRPTLVPDND